MSAVQREMDAPARFAIGPLSMAIEERVLRRFEATAAAGDELIYASGPAAPQTAESFRLAGEWGRSGKLVLFTRPRADGKGKDWWARKPALAPATPGKAAAAKLHPEAEAVWAVLRQAAQLQWVCPTDAELAVRCRLPDAGVARYRRGQLIKAGLVRFTGDGKLERRICTIVRTGQSTVAGAIARRRT